MRQLGRGVLFLCIALFYSQVSADEPTQKPVIWKVFPFEEVAVLISSDYQIWLIQGLQPNRLTWDEWIWRDDVPQPDPRYTLDIKQWKVGTPISIVHSPWQESEWQEDYRNDASLLEDCEYSIENITHNACVFAKPLQADEFINLGLDAYDIASAELRKGRILYANGLFCNVKRFMSFTDQVLTECQNRDQELPFNKEYTRFNDVSGMYPRLRGCETIK